MTNDNSDPTFNCVHLLKTTIYVNATTILGKWSDRLLTNQLVQLKYVASISYETVQQALKKSDETLVEGMLCDFSYSAVRVD